MMVMRFFNPSGYSQSSDVAAVGIVYFFAIVFFLVCYIFYFLTTLIININYNNATFVVWN